MCASRHAQPFPAVGANVCSSQERTSALGERTAQTSQLSAYSCRRLLTVVASPPEGLGTDATALVVGPKAGQMAEQDRVLARPKTTGSETLTRISLSSYLQGWRLTGVVVSVIALGALAVVVWHQGDVEGIRLVIRLTARVSLVLFSLAFTAPALARRLPNVRPRRHRRDRR